MDDQPSLAYGEYVPHPVGCSHTTAIAHKGTDECLLPQTVNYFAGKSVAAPIRRFRDRKYSYLILTGDAAETRTDLGASVARLRS
jgi:hypothetical protein